MIPNEPLVTQASVDLIRKLLSGPEERLGRNGAEEIKNHLFFEGIDFDPVTGIRKQQAPHVPHIRSPIDTSNFDAIDQDKLYSLNNSSDQGNGLGKYKTNHLKDYVNGDRLDYNGKHPDHAFFEFTFRRFFDDGGHPYPIRVDIGLCDKPVNGHSNGQCSTGETNQGSPVYV